jgi:hypothetical protein
MTAVQVRLNYILRNIDNFYLVYNDTHYIGGPFDGRSNRALVAKITHSFHF